MRLVGAPCVAASHARGATDCCITRGRAPAVELTIKVAVEVQSEVHHLHVPRLLVVSAVEAAVSPEGSG